MICFSKILGFPFRNDGKLFLFFTACYIPDHIPEWKQNIKVKKKKKKILGPNRLLGPWLAYIAPVSVSVHRFPFSSVFSVPFLFTVGGKTFHVSFFFPFLRHVEAVEDEKRAESGIQSFLARVEPSYVPHLSLWCPKSSKHNRIPGSWSKCINRHVYCMCT